VPVDSAGAAPGSPPFGTELSPAALRAAGLVRSLGAADAGDVDVRITGPVRDQVSGMIGWPSLGSVVAEIRAAVTALLTEGRRPLILGGCCTVLMGAAPAARDVRARIGLAYVDGHLDAYDNRSSPTGEAADMPVAALLGLGWPELLAAMGMMPVIDAQDIFLLGARDEGEAADLGDLPSELGLRVYGPDAIAADPAAVGRAACAHFASAALPYWLHLDVDVLDEQVFPATDYLMPGGLDLPELADLLRPLGQDPRLIGASIGCYNPQQDPGMHCGAALTGLLADVLG
jgi:arginase